MPVRVQGPDGKTYQFPDGTDKDAAVRYFKSHNIGVSSQSTDPSGRTPTGEPAPGDTRTGFQRTLDNLITPDPRREEWQSPTRSLIDDAAQHVASNVLPLISHPVKSAEGLISSVGNAAEQSHGDPMQFGQELARPLIEKAVEDYEAHGPVRGTTDLLGTGAGMAATGELGGAAGKVLGRGVKALSEPLQSGGGGLIDRAAGSLKSDFAHGAQPGRAYLEGGGTPALTLRGLGEKAEAVKNTAGEKLGQAYDAASQPTPPAPIRGLLQAPQYDVPLADSPNVTGRLSKPITLHQPDRPMPLQLNAPRNISSETPLIETPGREPEMHPMAFDAEKFPQRNIVGGVGPQAARELGSTATTVPSRLTREAFMSGSEHPELSGQIPVSQGILRRFESPSDEPAEGMGPGDYIGQISGERGGGGQSQGVLRTRNPELAGQVPEPSGTPFPAGATRISAGDVRSALINPVDRLRAIQNGPGGVGSSSLLDDYEGGIRDATTGDFTPRSLFDLKRNVAANTRWNDPTMFDMNSVRQQGVGGVGQLLTDAVPETAPLNRIYQGSSNLADRANLRADTGTPPFTSLVNRGLEGAAGVGLGMATHDPFLAAAPLLMDSVPVKTSAGYLLYQGGKLAGKVPNLGPAAATTGALLPQETQ